MTTENGSVVVRSCEVLLGDAVASHRDIHMTNGRITALVETGRLDSPASTTVIDGTGLLAMPGLINSHTHAAMTMLRGAHHRIPRHLHLQRRRSTVGC